MSRFPSQDTSIFLAVLVVWLALAPSLAPVSAATPAGAENVTVYRATDGSYDDPDAVETSIDGETINPADRIVLGDTLVVAIRSERLTESLDTANGSTTERFFYALDGEAEFRLVQTNMDTHSAPKVPPLGPENVTVYRNGTTTYVLVDTGTLSFHRYLVNRDEYEPDQLRDGDQFAVEFGYDLDDIPFHGATYWNPAGPEVTVHTAENGLPETATRTPTETPSETATATQTVSTGNQTAASPPTTTDGDGDGFAQITAFVALFVLTIAAINRR